MNRRKFFAGLALVPALPVAAATAATGGEWGRGAGHMLAGSAKLLRDSVAYRATAAVDGYGTLTITDERGRRRLTMGPAGVTTYDRNEKPEFRLSDWRAA